MPSETLGSELTVLPKDSPKKTRFLVPKKLTSPPVLTKKCGVVPGRVDRWHHLILGSLKVLVILKLNPGEISVN